MIFKWLGEFVFSLVAGLALSIVTLGIFSYFAETVQALTGALWFQGITIVQLIMNRKGK